MTSAPRESPHRMLDRGIRSGLLVGIVLTALAGTWTAVRHGRQADADLRASLLGQARAVARTIDAGAVATLSFTDADRQRPAFQRIRSQMIAGAGALGIRSMYSLALSGREIRFGPESLPEGDPFASPPGTVYRQPPVEIEAVLRSGQAVTAGPYADEYGSFVSAFAPVIDPGSGDVSMVVGVDTEAARWHDAIATARRPVVIFGVAMIVLLATGLGLLVWRDSLAPDRQWRLRHIEPVLCATAGLLLSAGTAWMVHAADRRSDREAFLALARAQTAAIAEEIRDLRAALDHIALLFESSESVDRKEFRAFCSRLTRDTGCEVCVWMPEVEPGAAATVEAAAHAEGVDGFAVWRLDERGERAAPDPREILYPALYVEPLAGHETLLGYDLGSDLIRRAAIDEARRTGMPSASEPVPLIALPDQPQGLLLVQPVMSARPPGVAALEVRIDRLTVRTMRMGGASEGAVVAGVFLLTSNTPPRFLGCSAPHHDGTQCMGGHAGGLSLATPLFAFGRTYAIVVHTLPNWFQSRVPWTGWVTGMAGFLVTMLLSGVVLIITRQRTDLLREVDRKTADLQREQGNLRALMDSAPVAVLVFDATARIVSANAAAKRLFQRNSFDGGSVRAGEFLCCTNRLVTPAGCGHSLLCEACPLNTGLRAVIATGEGVHDREMDADLDLDGGRQTRHLRFSIEPAILGDRLHAVAAVIDETDRHHAREQYQLLFREMLDGFALHEMVYDDAGRPIDYRFLSVNPAFETMTGLRADRTVGRTVRELLPDTEPFCIETYGRVALTGQPARFEQFSAALGRHFEVAAFRAAPGRFACVFADITARRQAEEGKQAAQADTARLLESAKQSRRAILSMMEDQKRTEDDRMKLHAQLMQTQKMESIGTLAGGVAHDFNNKLHVIQGFVDWAIEAAGPHSELQPALLEIRKAALHSADITRQLLAFARKQPIHPRVLDLNETVSGMIKMLRRLIGEDIDLIWKPGAGVWPVSMDPSQVDQILANLAANARDAIHGVGAVNVTTGNTHLDAAQCANGTDAVPGDYVRLIFADTGNGMDEATLAHSFEPFFTTKDIGKGTGLGLATVDGIVRQNGGFIRVDSRPGSGTTFAILLPRHHAKAPANSDETEPKPAPGTETILAVEDEPPILALCEDVLCGFGYDMLTAASPAEALAIAAQHPGRIDLLLTDVVMPGMNGRALKEKLAADRPDLRVLYMSGFPADALGHHGFIEEGMPLLQKPFSASILALRVREILDA